MFGFIIGTISFIALLKVVRSYRRGYRCAGGYGEFGDWHRGGWGHHHHHGSWHGRRGWHHGGGWRRMALYSLFERLDATGHLWATAAAVRMATAPEPASLGHR